jgi:ActR/RegA family two-component response regulator
MHRSRINILASYDHEQPRSWYGVAVVDFGATLSVDQQTRAQRSAGATEPMLVLALECSRPQALSARYRISRANAVVIGRGESRRGELVPAEDGVEISIRVPDRWMSSRHARIEPSFGRWILVDTESKNGSVVDGHSTRRSVLTDGSVIEFGHTVFIFFEKANVPNDAPIIWDLEGGQDLAGMTTLLGSWHFELERLRQIAPSEIPILIEGESGTGKEILARAVHALSGRSGAFVPVNCGALPENLVESELFGYKKGAFSGAGTDQPGLVRSADGGTLFLDEIGDLPPSSQAALLRVLQEREVMPVGGTRSVPIDLRVVAATHRDLDEMVAQGGFRHDLFARLAGLRITIPSVAERRPDVGILIGTLFERIFPPGHPGVEAEAARLLFRYPWPLNVREIEQALSTAKVLAQANAVRSEHLPDTVRSGRPPGAPKPAPLTEVDQKVREDVIRALREHQGNVSAVARALDKDRKQIQRWIKRFGLDPTSYR